MVAGTDIAVGKVSGGVEGAGEAGSDEVGAQGADIRCRIQEILVEVIADTGAQIQSVGRGTIYAIHIERSVVIAIDTIGDKRLASLAQSTARVEEGLSGSG